MFPESSATVGVSITGGTGYVGEGTVRRLRVRLADEEDRDVLLLRTPIEPFPVLRLADGASGGVLPSSQQGIDGHRGGQRSLAKLPRFPGCFLCGVILVKPVAGLYLGSVKSAWNAGGE